MKQKREYKLYMHINLINDKKYIGITKLKLKERWRNGGAGYKCQAFYNAIQKYGWDNFKHELIFQNLTKEEAEMFEIQLIKYYKSDNKRYGYNIAKGGNIKGCCAESTIQKLKLINKGRKASLETRKKISKNHANVKGMNNPMYGKTGDLSPNYNKGKEIICLETKEIFKSIRIAGEKLNILPTNISAVLNKRQISTNGLHFVLLSEYNENNKYNLSIGYHRKIICTNTNIIYDSIKEASEKLNLDTSAITKVCKKKNKHTNGLHFEYYEDFIKCLVK